MDSIASLPRSIAEAFEPTADAYTPLLLNRADDIRSTRKETYQYGSHPRQTLDVYYPTRKRRRASITKSKEPVLIYIHGGGLVRGSKTLPFADGLAHANVGHFFADNLGYTTVIPDYRLMSHGARFPSGGEDVALIVDWIRETLTRQGGYSSIELFALANSAGGVHFATYALSPEFAGSRSKVLSLESESVVQLRGIIFLSVPYNFTTPAPHRTETLQAYFGSDLFASSPQGLLRNALVQDPDNVLPNVRTLILSCELDPDDEILRPTQDFLDEWRNGDEDSFNAVVVETLAGHNHLSPPLSLGTGIEREENWGYQVGYFVESLRE